MSREFYSVIGKININGHIGPSYVDKAGQLHKGTELLDVIEQVESFPEATKLEISINSPGGYVDIGDSIYDYLLSLKKKGKQVSTIQTGLIGSIATKIFLAGDRRIVDDRYEFFIHNPFQADVSGDQDDFRAIADGLEETEKNLRKFYAQFTKITDEGLDGLMKIETGLTADQCIKFGFATEKKLVPVFNFVNKNNKKVATKAAEKKDANALLAYLNDFFSGNKGKAKGIAPKKNAIPINPGAEAKSLVVNLADNAGSFWVEGEAVAEGSPCFLLDADGQPTQEALADGDYVLEDGTKLTVAEGKISAMVPVDPAEEEEEMVAKSEVDAMIKSAVEEALKGVKSEVESTKAEILNLKKTAKLGIAPTKAFLNPNRGADGPVVYKTIAMIQAEKEEKRRNHNKN